ncbi:MAG: hypothetical protein ACI8TX_000287 [Hyphomicrobiaceae bacterium]|jgi:hypothetical protein
MIKATIPAAVCALSVLFLLAGSATSGFAQPSADQIRCLNSLAKAETKLAKIQGKEVGKCMKFFSVGKLADCQSAEGCLIADVKGKVAKLAEKLRSASLKSCADDDPGFGTADVVDATRWVRFHTNGLNADVVGAALDTNLATRDGDAATTKCQSKVTKAVQKLADVRLAAYAKCKKLGLADGSIVDAAGLEVCRAAVRAQTGKLEKTESKVGKTLAKTCQDLDLAQALPGQCGAAGDVGECLLERARCRFCLLSEKLDDLSDVCDDYDDGAINDSCKSADGRCNGSSLLCDRAFDAVSYPTSHNAFTNADEGWGVPNQNLGMARQLEDGVRSLMLDTHYFEGSAHLCHSTCNQNEISKWREPLVDGLVRVAEFLDENPGEVVSFILEAYISEADTATAMAAAGLDVYAHEQTLGQPWPTLQELIDSGKRLIVFTDDGSASLPWHHYVWDFAWETHFSAGSVNDFTCDINRGNIANSLFILNHFLTDIGGSDVLAQRANARSFFLGRAEQCQTESGRLPNFVTVDFVDIGVLYEVVDTANDVGTCTP